jgi:hypothetical protein
MFSLSRVVSALVLSASLLYASPTLSNTAKLKRSVGPVNPGSYIVVLEPDAVKSAAIESLRAFSGSLDSSSREGTGVTYDDWEGMSAVNLSIGSTPIHLLIVINGYSARLSREELEHVLSDPNVAYVEEDATVQCSTATPDSR